MAWNGRKIDRGVFLNARKAIAPQQTSRSTESIQIRGLPSHLGKKEIHPLWWVAWQG
jgi:hypothetical protein